MRIFKVLLSFATGAIIWIVFFSQVSYSADTDNTWLSGNLFVREEETKGPRCVEASYEGLAAVEGSPATSFYTGCETKGNRFSFLYKDSYSERVFAARDNQLSYGWKFRRIALGPQQKLWAVAGGDVLVETEYLPDDNKTKVYVYTDLDNALYPTLVTGGVYYEYGINRSAPGTKIFEIDYKVSSLKLTPDAKYVFTKNYNSDTYFGELVKIDTIANTKEHIQAANPYDEVFAVSDDGRYTLVQQDMYDTQRCAISSDTTQKVCQSRSISEAINAHFGGYITFTDGRMSEFSESGSRLTINASVVMPDYLSHGQYKSLTVSTYKLLDYLALGDSYSSGEGDLETDSKGNRYYTADTLEGCHLSTRSYPYLLRSKWGIDNSKMASVACSGALLTEDYAVPMDKYDGQYKELLRATDTQGRQGMIDAAFNYFVPGRVPQIEFVKRYQPKVLTVTGSGNDVGFSEILKYCAGDVIESWLNYTCEYAKDGILREVLNDSIDSQYEPIREFIRKVQRVSPSTKIYYVGYPSFIAGKDGSCALNNGSLDDDEREMINESIHRLNTVIYQAVSSMNIEYIDIEKSLEGGRLCEGSKYMTGLWDVGITNISNLNILQQAFHPNAKGHSKIAESISNKVKGVNQTYSPTQPTVVAIKPGIPTSRAKIVKDDTFPEGESLVIHLSPGTTTGLSEYYVTAFSQRTELGAHKSNMDGSVDLKVSLPESLSRGIHVILLDIVNSNGGAERLYQYINIVKKDDSLTGSDLRTTTRGESEVVIQEARPELLENIYLENGQSFVSDKSGTLDEKNKMPYTNTQSSIDNSQRMSNEFIFIIIAAIISIIIGGVYAKKRR